MSLYFGPANATARGQPQPRTRRGLQQVRSAAAHLSARCVTARMQWLHDIAAAVPPAQMIFGVGLQEGPGSSNASCAGAGAPCTATACSFSHSVSSRRLR